MKKTIGKVILATTLLFGSVATNIKASDKVDFVAIGDSITTGYGLEGYRPPNPNAKPPVLAYAKDSFVEFLNETYKVNTTNMAVDGLTSLYLAKRTDKQVLSAEQQAIIKDADVISVTIGGNDLLSTFMLLAAKEFNIFLNGPTGKDPTDLAKRDELVKAIANPANTATIQKVLGDMKTLHLENLKVAFKANLEAIIKNIKGLNQNAQILVQTIANPYNDLAANQPDLVSGIDEGVKAFNTIINQGAVTTGAYRVADVYTTAI